MRHFRVLADPLAIVRLEPASPQPSWATGQFVSVTRTESELSIVCDQSAVPQSLVAERGWRGLQLEGTFDLDQTGIAAGFTGVLAAAEIAVFVLATHDTDYVLVRESRLPAAVTALRNAGYGIRDDPSAGNDSSPR
ncbi:MAG: ACT domain-containing protein [Thermoanaerobaculia bacterium]